MKSLLSENNVLSQNNDKIWIIYDGECPVCSAYVRFIRLKEIYSDVVLLNARQKSPIINDILDAGYDLNEGMVLKINEQIYHGDLSIHMMSLMTTQSGLFNRFNTWIFKSKDERGLFIRFSVLDAIRYYRYLASQNFRVNCCSRCLAYLINKT